MIVVLKKTDGIKIFENVENFSYLTSGEIVLTAVGTVAKINPGDMLRKIVIYTDSGIEIEEIFHG